MKKLIITIALAMLSANAFADTLRHCAQEQVYTQQYGWVWANICHDVEVAPAPPPQTIIYSYAPPPTVVYVERERHSDIWPFVAGIGIGAIIEHGGRRHYRR